MISSMLLLQPAQAKSSSQIKNEISVQNQKIQEAQKKVKQLKKSAADQQELLDALSDEIEEMQKRVDLTNQRLEELDAQIQEKKEEIEQKNLELEAIKDKFDARLRAMYISGANADLLMLLGAEDVADYLSRQELMENISQQDKEMVNQITATITSIEKSKNEIEVKQEETESEKKQLASDQAALKAKYQEAQSLMASIDQSKSEAEEDYEDAQAAKDALEAELNRLSTSGSHANVVYSGGDFQWPVPSCYSLSSPFGWRWGRQHKGVDISNGGIYGKPIVAAADGVVLVAGYNAGGYGNYVSINHGTKDGNQYVTLYGHMSRYIVSSGQKVSRGQTIGYVGSTGRSTGPHCHFEIKVNGTAVNPMQFF